MRMRIAVLASALCALAVVSVSGVNAAPTHRLSINAVPNPINAGEGVLIYGQLGGSNHANRLVRLYQRLTVPGQRYHLVAKTRTDSSGIYEFVRADVTTNRNWFTAVPGLTHSHKVHERVHAPARPNASVTLYAKPAGQSNYVAVGSVNTGTDGSYKFSVSPTSNSDYQTRTTFAPARHGAVLFEGVRDVVSMSASASSGKVGSKVTF